MIRFHERPFCLRCVRHRVCLWEFVLLGSLCLQEQLAQPRQVDHLVRLAIPTTSFRTGSHLQMDSIEHSLSSSLHMFTL